MTELLGSLGEMAVDEGEAAMWKKRALESGAHMGLLLPAVHDSPVLVADARVDRMRQMPYDARTRESLLHLVSAISGGVGKRLHASEVGAVICQVH